MFSSSFHWIQIEVNADWIMIKLSFDPLWVLIRISLSSASNWNSRGFNKRWGWIYTAFSLCFHVICLAESTGIPTPLRSKSMGDPSGTNSESMENPIKNISESIRNLLNKPYERKQLGIHQRSFQNQWRIRWNTSKPIEIHPKPFQNQWSITANPFQNQRRIFWTDRILKGFSSHSQWISIAFSMGFASILNVFRYRSQWIWIAFSMHFDGMLNRCWLRWVFPAIPSHLIPHVPFHVFMLQGIGIMTDAASRRIFFYFPQPPGACPLIENCLASLELYSPV